MLLNSYNIYYGLIIAIIIGYLLQQQYEQYGGVIPYSVAGLPIAQIPVEREDLVPLHGNDIFNINSLLHTNIVEADYFKALVQLQTCNDIIDEIKIEKD